MSDKTRQAQIKRLEVQLKKPENKECFDCTSKQPRWASTNLGIFLCLRCAGIHRSLGVHITKVKSTTMDAWEEHMIQTAERIGNARGKTIYEHSYKQPKSDVNASTQDVERITRRKFEMKQWYAPNADEMIQNYMNMGPEANGGSKGVPAAGAGGVPVSSPPVVTSPVVVTAQPVVQQQQQQQPSLLGTAPPAAPKSELDWGGFESSASSPAAPASTTSAKKDDFWDAFGTTSPQPSSSPSSSAQPDFGGFQQSPTVPPTTMSTQPAPAPTSAPGDFMSFQPQTTQPSAAAPVTPQQKQNTDDILAAFGPSNGMNGGMGGPGGYPPPIGQQRGPGAMAGSYQHMAMAPHNPGQHLPPHHNPTQPVRQW